MTTQKRQLLMSIRIHHAAVRFVAAFLLGLTHIVGALERRWTKHAADPILAAYPPPSIGSLDDNLYLLRSEISNGRWVVLCAVNVLGASLVLPYRGTWYEYAGALITFVTGLWVALIAMAILRSPALDLPDGDDLALTKEVRLRSASLQRVRLSAQRTSMVAITIPVLVFVIGRLVGTK